MPGTPATAQQKAAMEKDVANLQVRMDLAEVYRSYLLGKLWNLDSEKAAIKNIYDEKFRFNTWKTTWRQWALDGWNPKDNMAYPVSFWQRIGKDIDSALLTYTNGASSPDNKKPLVFTDPNSLINVAIGVGKEISKDPLPFLPPPSTWPAWGKALAGVAVVATVVVTIHNAAIIARALRGAS
jgi:hypothetical protein